MRATGIVRRIDELGRVVIPKEIRRTMRIREGDPLEIYTDNNGEVIFKKYSPLSDLGIFANQYVEVLYKSCGFPAVVCDCDHVIAVAGIPKKELLERRVSPTMEEHMAQRKPFANNISDGTRLQPVEGVDRFAIACAPIITSGTVCGSIMLLGENATNIAAGDTEVMLISVAAAFLAKQMEE